MISAVNNQLDTVAVRASKGYIERYGEEPAGMWAAPGRVNLIGEHTDYNDGFVLPFALPLRTIVAASALDSPTWTVSSDHADDEVVFGEAELTPGAVSGWGGYVAGVVWALREAGFDIPGARMVLASDVPLGAGLSSSAALECAVLTALVELASGLDLPIERRPSLAQRAENHYVGAPTGIMDQSASTLCRAGHALFLDCRSLETAHIPFDLSAAGLAILVVDSRAPHRHADGEYADRRAACEAGAAALGVPALRDVSVEELPAALARLGSDTIRRRVRHIVTENQRVLQTVELLRAGRLTEIGPLMTASHASMRDDFEITVPEVDTAVEASLAAGAYGARMTGGGFGGCVLALIDTDAADRVSDAVAAAFADRGFTAPAAFVAVPSPGATRLPRS